MLLLLLRGEAFHGFEGGLVEGFAHRLRDAKTQVDLLDFVGRHLFIAAARLAGDSQRERAQLAELHRVAVEQQALHHLLKLIDRHFGLLRVQRRLVRHQLCHLMLVHLPHALKDCIPLSRALRVARVDPLHFVVE